MITSLFAFLLTFLPADPLDRRIDVAFQHTLLPEALEEIARRGKFEWSYNAALVRADKRVDLQVRDWTVREVLYKVLGDDFEFKTSGNYLILKKRRKTSGELSGYIRDPQSGKRLANVTVYDRQTLRATNTDSSGYYKLKVKNTTEVVIALSGFTDTVLQVKPQSPRFQSIELQELPPASRQEKQWNVNLRSTAYKIEKMFRATVMQWQQLNTKDSLHRQFQLSLLPTLGTNHTLSGKVTNDYSVNILAGASYSNEILELAGVGNFTNNTVKGFQAAGVFNITGDVNGLQAAGLFNITQRVRGAHAAGLFNIARQQADLQAAGLFNRAESCNVMQVAGLFNTARYAEGIQMAGLFNAAYDLNGWQLGGLFNSARYVDGAQVSGLYNRAEKVKGFQLGIINKTNELEGVQIGLINKAGRRTLPFLMINLKKKPAENR